MGYDERCYQNQSRGMGTRRFSYLGVIGELGGSFVSDTIDEGNGLTRRKQTVSHGNLIDARKDR
jgi:hypothetical protein